MPGDGASGGQAVCRPRGVEHLQDVPRVLMHSNLGAKTSRGLCLYFANSEFSRRRLCIRATASTPQFQQITYFSRLPKNPFRRRVTMASFCCQPIPRSYDPHQAQWLTGICGCFVSLLFIKSPTSPAEPDWPISCSYQMRECRYPAWWMAGCGPAGPLRWLRQRRQRSAGWRWCAAGSGRSRR